MNSSGVFWLGPASRVVCGLSLFCAASGAVRAAAPAQDRFLREAPQKWLEYRRIVSRHTEGSFKNVATFHIGGEVTTSTAEGTFAINSDCQGARLVALKAAVVCNPDYSFSLKGSEGDWTIRDVSALAGWSMPDDLMGRNSMNPLVKGEGGSFGEVMQNACAGQMLWGGWFPRMVSSPLFRLVRVTDMPGDGDLVKVEFEFEPSDLTGGNAPARSGMVVLDAERYWLIRQAETKASGVYGEGSLRITNEFTEGKLPVPFVSRCVINMVIPKNRQFGGKRYEGEFVLHTDMHDAPDLDKKQFMLTAFGMPEPEYAQPNRRRLWFALFGGVFLLLVFLLVRHRLQRGGP